MLTKLTRCKVISALIMSTPLTISSITVSSMAVSAEPTATVLPMQLAHLPPYSDATGAPSAIGNMWPIWQSYLPDYQLTEIWTSKTRTIDLINPDTKTCSAMLLHSPEREAQAYFSQPILIGIQQQLVISIDHFNEMGEPESLSLEALLQDETLFGAREVGRTYDDTIMSLMSAYHDSANLLPVTATNTKDMATLLRRNRIDYFIDYPGYLVQFLSEEDWQHVISVPIEEARPYTYTYFTCSKNDWGRLVIDDLNDMLAKAYHDEDYFEAMVAPFRHDLRYEWMVRSAFDEVRSNFANQ